jgi:hypothetical protein
VRRHAAAVLIAFATATSVIGTHASPVSAECMYLPPWPPITHAIPTAQQIVVGQVIDASEADLHLGPDQGPREYALRVTHVLRGGARPGDVLDIQYLLPNWPQTRYLGGDGTTAASCTYLRAAPGEVIALAFDALQPGGPMSENGTSWIQPPTRYNAVGVLAGHADEAGTEWVRERVTLPQLLDLAPMSLDETDQQAQPSSDGANLLLAVVIGLAVALGGVTVARWGRRVAPSGVRRRER